MTLQATGADRRTQHGLREIFAEACQIVAPIMSGANKTLGVSSFSLMHVLQESYPHLSSSEIHVMVVTIERLHREGRLNSVSS